MSSQAEAALCEEKLIRAQKLIGGLGGEKVRWTTAAAELGGTYTRLVGEWLTAHVSVLTHSACERGVPHTGAGRGRVGNRAVAGAGLPSLGMAARRVTSWSSSGCPERVHFMPPVQATCCCRRR